MAKEITVVGGAVSGGLDSCTVTHWLNSKGFSVRGFTVDLGQPDEERLDTVKDRMIACGAEDARIIPGQDALAEAQAARALRLMRAPWGRLFCTALVLAACAQPQVLRDGVMMPYERAAEADLRRARELIAGGRLEQARGVLDGFLAELPSSRRTDEALFLLGEVQLELGDAERAALTWRRLLERHPRSRLAPETRLRTARTYRELGLPEIGRRILAEARFERADDQLRVQILCNRTLSSSNSRIFTSF